VAYTVKDQRLVRYTWGVLDRAPNSEPQQSVLLENVKAVQVQFFDLQNGKFTAQRHWPRLTGGNTGAGANPLPRAIELTLDVEGWGRITRLFRIAGTEPLNAGPPVL
jgi:general secretion pathway protein J